MSSPYQVCWHSDMKKLKKLGKKFIFDAGRGRLEYCAFLKFFLFLLLNFLDHKQFERSSGELKPC